jgi:predicted transcriptional regulator
LYSIRQSRKKYPADFLLRILKLIKMIKINDSLYLTLHEYAKEKNVTIQTVYNWIKDKRVETKKLMNMTLIKL